MRVGCWKGWCFLPGFARPVQLALVDSFLRRVLAPSTGAA